MTNPIKAIETRYAGCRFRSRTEARWAVFLDQLGIGWDYEAQGFHTPAGGYLPDFLLENGRFVEIKGPAPTERDLAKCQAVDNLIILVGSIPRKPEDLTWWEFGPCRNGKIHFFHRCDDGWQILTGWPFGETRSREDVQAALTYARSARFEHGERP